MKSIMLSMRRNESLETKLWWGMLAYSRAASAAATAAVAPAAASAAFAAAKYGMGRGGSPGG